jgi:hypothetical protein
MGGPPNHTEDEGEGEDGETEQMRLQYTPYKEMNKGIEKIKKRSDRKER